MHHSNFVHLHLHTQYSLLDGMIRPGPMFDLARKYKMPAVAMTDHGNLFGAVDFYQKAIKKGIKPIIGSEVYVAPGKRSEKGSGGRGAGRETNYHLILLVKNAKGYKNLCKLLTLANLEGFYYRPRVDKDILAEYNEGLIVLSACLHGEISYHLNHGQGERAAEAAAFYRDTFKNRFFLELQDGGLPEQKKVNEELLALGGRLEIPVVATNDCHYLTREEAKYHDLLLCIQTGKTVNSEDRMRFQTDQIYFKSPEEMETLFSHVPEAIRNTVEIAERCNLELELGEPHLPEFAVPKGETLDSRLDSVAREGLRLRLESMARKGMDVESVKWEYFDRLKKELHVIEGMGFSGYFLIVSDFIEHARSKNIPVGPGRGSAAGSLVAYSLGITNLDPIRHNLLFERFLNPDRISLPDIDIDFSNEGRDDVIKYVTEKYGKDNVTQIITFGQMKARAVIRDVGRALDMTYGEVDRIAKLVPNQLNITIEEALEQEEELRKCKNEDERIEELISAAKMLEGLPRHASTHAAGVVIANKPLVEYLPLYMGQKDNVVTTQFPMKDVENIGLVKFDFLGLKTLGLMERAKKIIKSKKGVDIDLEDLSVDDPKAYELLCSANTNGIFQLESSGIKELLRKLKPSTFEDLMAAVALYRPGPLKSGMVDDFIKRKHKKVEIRYDLPDLKDILENTYGVIVYQEQVMQIVRALAGFTPGEADVLRKVMGKKLTDEMLELRKKFLDGASEKKIPKKKAGEIFDLIAHFAGYGFNKSHSAAYALIAYQTAYLKAYYPVEFMAALLTSDMGDTDKVIKYMSECKEMGIDVLPPDLNTSQMDFTVEDERILFGLGAIKNVGESAIESILKVRENEPFTSMLDFLTRVDSRKVNRKVVESLVKCGAMDFAGQTRATCMASLNTQMDAAQGVQRDKELGQGSIFDCIDGGGAEVAMPTVTEVAEWPDNEKMSYEKETLGVYISSHPLEGHTERLARVTSETAEGLRERKGETVASVGGVVAELKEINTKKGARMAFVKIEDLTGSVEAVIFADLYKKKREILAPDSLIVVTGRTDKGDESVKIIAEDIVPLDQAEEVEVKKVHIRAHADVMDAEKIEKLKKTLKSRPGTSPVFLHLLYPGGKDVVIGLPASLSINAREETFALIKRALPDPEIHIQ